MCIMHSQHTRGDFIKYMKIDKEMPKDERLQLLLTKEEREAIEEWRYANKIPSRNEAIRRLIKKGLLSKK